MAIRLRKGGYHPEFGRQERERLSSPLTQSCTALVWAFPSHPLHLELFTWRSS